MASNADPGALTTRLVLLARIREPSIAARHGRSDRSPSTIVQRAKFQSPGSLETLSPSQPRTLDKMKKYALNPER